MRRLTVLAAAIFLSSCAAKTLYVTTPLPLPPAPDYATVYGEELMCLTEDAYSRLAVTVMQRESYIETLRAIIATTHQGSDE